MTRPKGTPTQGDATAKQRALRTAWYGLYRAVDELRNDGMKRCPTRAINE